MSDADDDLDDLDEHDSELELRLKREYADVFPLFSYCVVTEEATYLCNGLHVDCAPSGGYVMFEMRLDDVWVWDRNRPTRILPRAHVYTSGDVTIEQLRELRDDEEPAQLPTRVAEGLRRAARTGDPAAVDDADVHRDEESVAAPDGGVDDDASLDASAEGAGTAPHAQVDADAADAGSSTTSDAPADVPPRDE